MDGSVAGKRRFIVTVDDPGGLIQDPAIMQRVVDFFDGLQVPASFFVIPRGQGGWQLDRQGDFLAVARGAEAQGHDCQLHGLDHSPCEFGPSPAFLAAMSGADPALRLRQEREKVGHLWRQELYEEKLHTAISMFAEAFGRRPLLFRTGALSQSPELYHAVAQADISYVSNRVIDPRGWFYIGGQYESPGDWDPAVPPAPYRLTPEVIDLPIISEFAWQLTPEKVEPHLALALEDLRRVYESGGVYLLVCHVQEVGADYDLPRVLLRRLITSARDDWQVTFQTVSQLVADIEGGQIEVLPHQPDNLEGVNYHAH